MPATTSRQVSRRRPRRRQDKAKVFRLIPEHDATFAQLGRPGKLRDSTLDGLALIWLPCLEHSLACVFVVARTLVLVFNCLHLITITRCTKRKRAPSAFWCTSGPLVWRGRSQFTCKFERLKSCRARLFFFASFPGPAGFSDTPN